jgi:hypothetical protein
VKSFKSWKKHFKKAPLKENCQSTENEQLKTLKKKASVIKTQPSQSNLSLKVMMQSIEKKKINHLRNKTTQVQLSLKGK